MNQTTIETSSGQFSQGTVFWYLYLSTAIISIISNLFICVTIIRRNRLKSTTYKLIFNMAISDIIGGVVIPCQLLSCSYLIWKLGPYIIYLCVVMKSVQIVSYYVSSMTLFTIAYYHYRSICLRITRRLRVRYILISIWILSIVCSSENVLTLTMLNSSTLLQAMILSCHVEVLYFGFPLRQASYLIQLFLQYLIPLGLTGLFYVLVLRTIRSIENDSSEFSLKKKQTVSMFIVITMLFAVSHLPIQTINFLTFNLDWLNYEQNCGLITFYLVCYWLGIISCAYNPFVYWYFNDMIQKEVRGFGRRLSCRNMEHDDVNDVTVTYSTNDPNEQTSLNRTPLKDYMKSEPN